MATIALCWELGGGAGHLAPLSDYAVAASLQNHRVCLFARENVHLSAFPAFADTEAAVAPRFDMPAKLAPAINYSSIMWRSGYQDSQVLLELVRAWMKSFEKQKVDLVIADHSPTALLAARILEIPSVLAGNGFSAPPSSDPMPSILPWLKVPEDKLKGMDSQVLTNINHVCQELRQGDCHLERVGQLFAADAWLATIDELDHNRRSNGIYLAVHSEQRKRLKPEWPDGKGDNIFVYFDRTSRHLPNLFAQLKQIARPVVAVVPGLSEQQTRQFSATNIRFYSEFLDLSEIARECRTVITHGGHALVRDFLALGIPCLILPDLVERVLLAFRAASAGVGFAGTPDISQVDLAEMLAVSERSESVWLRSQAVARRLDERNAAYDLDQLLEKKLQALHLA